MKTKGVIKVSGLQLPQECPVQLQDIEISYDVEYSVGEFVELLKVIPTLPDIMADTYRKFKQYEAEFNADKDTAAANEVSDVIADIKKQDEQSA